MNIQKSQPCTAFYATDQGNILVVVYLHSHRQAQTFVTLHLIFVTFVPFTWSLYLSTFHLIFVPFNLSPDLCNLCTFHLISNGILLCTRVKEEIVTFSHLSPKCNKEMVWCGAKGKSVFRQKLTLLHTCRLFQGPPKHVRYAHTFPCSKPTCRDAVGRNAPFWAVSFVPQYMGLELSPLWQCFQFSKMWCCAIVARANITIFTLSQGYSFILLLTLDDGVTCTSTPGKLWPRHSENSCIPTKECFPGIVAYPVSE